MRTFTREFRNEKVKIKTREETTIKKLFPSETCSDPW
jgi:hypothetical protein